MIPIEELKVGDIVWSMGALHPVPSFVSEIHEGAVWLSQNKKPPSVGFCNNTVFRTYEELMLVYWEPKVLSKEADQELKDAVSHAYNSGVGSFSVGKSEPSDLVHRDGDKWYFWDETLAYRDGPYDTEEEARDKMQDYAETVLGHQPTTNIQTHGSFEHSDGTLRCTPEVHAPTANARLSMEHSKKMFDRHRKGAKTFAEAMTDVTRVMKKLGDTLGSVVNPCAEMLESTPPDTDSNEFVEALKSNGLMERDCSDEETECYQCNVINTVFLPERKIGAWAGGECVCNYIKSRSHYTREGNFIGSRKNFNKTVLSGARLDTVDHEIEIHVHDAAKEAWDKKMKAVYEAAENDGFVMPMSPLVEINITDEMRESVKKGLLAHWGQEREVKPNEADECDCGGPDGHVTGGSHCRKPL